LQKFCFSILPFFLPRYCFPDLSQKSNEIFYPLFSYILTSFCIQIVFITFLCNQSGSINFCNYQPILIKFSLLFSLTWEWWDDTVSIDHNGICYDLFGEPQGRLPTILKFGANNYFHFFQIGTKCAIKWRPKLFWTFCPIALKIIEGWFQGRLPMYKHATLETYLTEIDQWPMEPKGSYLKYDS